MMIAMVVRIAGSVLMADFLSGLAHWIEDSYFSPQTPLIGSTIRKNVLHHSQPQAFVGNPWHVTIRSSLFWSVSTAVVLYPFGFLGPMWVGALVLAVFANQIHKWSHTNWAAVPRIIRWFQASGVLQTPAHHKRHHGGRRGTHYCLVTNALNPDLHGLRFWRDLGGRVQSGTREQRQARGAYHAR